MSALWSRSMTEVAELIASKKASSVEVVRAVLERIAAVEPGVHAYRALHAEEALEGARQRDVQGPDPSRPLHGVPVAVKDNLCVEGWEVRCASKILEGYVAPYDATVVARLKSAGAVLLGLTNMDEFAMGSSTEHSAYGPTKNPWDPRRVPGGSSGGSAAAVAAGEAIAALGSDTGGSIRQPAAFCGVVGFKPTYGRVSRYGLIAFASSLDQVGPLTHTVSDAALMYAVVAGHDPRDATSLPAAAQAGPVARRGGSRPLQGLRVGKPREYYAEGLEPVVRDAVERSLATLAGLGAEVVDVELPHTKYGLSTYYLIAPSEASSNLARYDGMHIGFRAPGTFTTAAALSEATRAQGFGAEVKRRILLGTYALSSGYYDAYYLKALKVRTLIKRDFEAAFASCDILATPTAPTPPFAFGEKTGNPVQMYLSDSLTIPANLAGLPALSLPCGRTPEGLPLGLQLIGKVMDEATVLSVAGAFEAASAPPVRTS